MLSGPAVEFPTTSFIPSRVVNRHGAQATPRHTVAAMLLLIVEFETTSLVKS